MTSVSSWLLPSPILISCLNAAVASLVACGIALLLTRHRAWTLPVRHALLVSALAVSLAMPCLAPFVQMPSFWGIRISPSTEDAAASRGATTAGTTQSQVLHREDHIESASEAMKHVANGRMEPLTIFDSTLNARPVPIPNTIVTIANQPLRTMTLPSQPMPWGPVFGTLLCSVWFAGTMVCLVKAISSLARLRRWSQSIAIADSQSVLTLTRSAATSIGLRNTVQVCFSSLLPAPVTFGLLHPKIVLPAEIESNLSLEQLRAVIQHEMAHIARRDLWIGVLQQMTAIVYWWNPLVLLASSQLADFREQICDDIAIRELPEPSAYAATLVELAERCSRSLPVPATLGIGTSSAGQLENRIRRIISTSAYRCVRLTRLARISVLAAVVLMSATVLLAQIQIKSPVKGNANDRPKATIAEPATTQTIKDQEPAVVKDAKPVKERDPFGHNYGDVDVPGHVVDPKGNPVADATVFLRKYGVRAPSRKAVTDAEGRFTFTTFRRQGVKLIGENPYPRVTKETLPGGITITITETERPQGAPFTDEEEIKVITPDVVATAEGFGFGTQRNVDDPAIKLVADEPITGRITDQNGKPLAGARIRVRNVFWPRRADDLVAMRQTHRGEEPVASVPDSDSLDLWLNEIRNTKSTRHFNSTYKYLVGLIESRSLGDKPEVYAALIPQVTTDTDGRFTLRGIGRERVAELYVDGVPDQASALIVVANRQIDAPILIPADSPIGIPAELDVSSSDRANGFQDLMVFGQTFELALMPGRSIEGVATDRETGSPLPGLRIVGPWVSRLEYPGFDRFITTTDAKGRYRIDGLPIMDRAQFKVDVSDKSFETRTPNQSSETVAYLGRKLSLKIEPGQGAFQVDFPLSHGIWITGKVIDESTGKPVSHATLEYYVFDSNPHLQKDLQAGIAPEFDDHDRLISNRDGTFKLRGYPGRGVVTVFEGYDYLLGVCDKIPDLETLYDADSFGPSQRNTTIEVNVPDGGASFTCELRLKKGISRTVRVVDPNGDLMSDLEASGQNREFPETISAVQLSEFEVINLYSDESRTVVARCIPREMIGMATVKASDRDPIILKLVPWASVTGRLVDNAGKPRSGDVKIHLEDGDLPSHILHGQDFDKKTIAIESNGTFHIDGLLPGAKYRLQVIDKDDEILGDITEDLTFKSGENGDLGDVTIMKSKETR